GGTGQPQGDPTRSAAAEVTEFRPALAAAGPAAEFESSARLAVEVKVEAGFGGAADPTAEGGEGAVEADRRGSFAVELRPVGEVAVAGGIGGGGGGRGGFVGGRPRAA